MGIRAVENFIKAQTGIKLKTDGLQLFNDKIQEMMAVRNIHSHEAYIDFLAQRPDEFNKIVNSLTINETYFLREYQHFKILTDVLAPKLLKTRPIIRILSAGCSTGEEPYSAAIALVEKYGIMLTENRFSIIGVDIDTNAIKKAQKGFFLKSSFRTLGTHLKKQYFDDLGNGKYQLKKSIRKLVKFQKYNLVKTPYPEAFDRNDIIFYRNVAIYFDPEIRQKIFKNFANILNNNGYLVVSATETLTHDMDILSLKEINGVFIYQKIFRNFFINKSMSLAGHKWFEPPPSLSFSRPPENSVNYDQIFNNALNMAQNKMYEQALKILEPLTQYPPFASDAYILKASIQINLQQTEAARQSCEKSIKINSLCAEAYLLLGIIAKTQGNIDEGITLFKKTLYISSSNWLAHFYLAKIYQDKGRTKQAYQRYKKIIQLLENNKFQDHGLPFFPFLFSKEQILHLCQKAIAHIE